MKAPTPRSKAALPLVAAALLTASLPEQTSAGVTGPAGDGGLQIVFSDDGTGGTLVTASGEGITDNDGSFPVVGLGFSSQDTVILPTRKSSKPFGIDTTTKLIPGVDNADLIDKTPLGAPPFPNTGAVPLTDPLSLNLSTFGTLVLGAFFSDSIDLGFQIGLFVDPVVGSAETLTATDGNGRIPLDYSVFSALHGQSLASTDGFTFVFAAALSTSGNGRPDLLIGKSAGRLKGDNVYDRNRPSNRQRLVTTRNIYKTNTARAVLRLQNDGPHPGTFSLKSSGDRRSGMDVFAKVVGGGNVTAKIKTGRFSQPLAPGESTTIRYLLRTNRFYAGVLNAGDRNEEVRFRMSGAGQKDNAAFLIRYVLPTGPTRLD